MPQPLRPPPPEHLERFSFLSCSQSSPSAVPRRWPRSGHGHASRRRLLLGLNPPCTGCRDSTYRNGFMSSRSRPFRRGSRRFASPDRFARQVSTHTSYGPALVSRRASEPSATEILPIILDEPPRSGDFRRGFSRRTDQTPARLTGQQFLHGFEPFFEICDCAGELPDDST